MPIFHHYLGQNTPCCSVFLTNTSLNSQLEKEEQLLCFPDYKTEIRQPKVKPSPGCARSRACEDTLDPWSGQLIQLQMLTKAVGNLSALYYTSRHILQERIKQSICIWRIRSL